MLYELLPLLRGWMFVHVPKDGYLTLGQEVHIGTVDAPGFFLVAYVVLSGSKDAKYVRFHIEFDGPEKAFPVDVDMYGAYMNYLTMPYNFGGFVTRYDDTEKIYAGAFAPSMPIPFSRRFEAKFIPPANPIEESTALPIRYHGHYVVVKIINMEEFRKSLAEVLHPVRAL